MKLRIYLLSLLALAPLLSVSQVKSKPSFQIVPLGVLGGIDESNLSAYMAAPVGSNKYVCLDAGTLHAGINKAINNSVFKTSADDVLKRYIKGYFISHSHLDHLGGLIINSPEDTAKNIYAFQDCINTFKNNYFTWKSWANFADEGEAPALKKYHYKLLTPNQQINVDDTEMQVTAFPLSHSNLTSTAFLLKHNDAYLLYLGDTGCDELEKSENLKKLWQVIAPLVKARQLKGIMIEVSFPNDQPDKSLFGHLTPRLLMQELNVLLGEAGSLKGLNVIVTHLKPPAKKIAQIISELKAGNKLGVNLIFPVQGRKIEL
ncbi:MBL fold metallo-hydrolase [Mucilaginibacter myungsuensis]|uniref:3',5'-cyclic-nucleotide phosphodiesterase n=1 Tax=Mucilaginibacter myungsuensis TaxID=649104 RepID=A0A929KXR2_9SPHI|nr:3',5'-cyclic-nucleotide phosphodiesterase [Mucilaginibacter myungsuensis]MBE9663594.1 3',5'-cyclic-nucleotide phosphodiesterase [Mucilaginibacter myungsuensis]MDN3599082.1 3',5'-cyclic-nucleotide phosphodiesterase [Mucilaginibacter myungsuensis]